jgi:hypothetical protein
VRCRTNPKIFQFLTTDPESLRDEWTLIRTDENPPALESYGAASEDPPSSEALWRASDSYFIFDFRSADAGEKKICLSIYGESRTGKSVWRQAVGAQEVAGEIKVIGLSKMEAATEKYFCEFV